MAGDQHGLLYDDEPRPTRTDLWATRIFVLAVVAGHPAYVDHLHCGFLCGHATSSLSTTKEFCPDIPMADHAAGPPHDADVHKRRGTIKSHRLNIAIQSAVMADVATPPMTALFRSRNAT